jgi:hypothetical protein
LLRCGVGRWLPRKARGTLERGAERGIDAPLCHDDGRWGESAWAASRFLAVRHKLTTVVAGSELPKALEAVTAFCGTIQCEVVSSSITCEMEESLPSGSLSMRVKPGDVDKLTAFVGKQGRIAQHITETEDKTAIVVDTYAKIKNLTEFRDTNLYMRNSKATGRAPD